MLSNSKIIHTLAAIAILSAIVAAAGLAQQKPTLTLAGDKSGLRLTIVADQASYHVGDKINIATKFENISDGPVHVLIDLPTDVFYHFVVVRMENPNSATPAELTATGKERIAIPRFFDRQLSIVPQNGALRDSFEMSPIYVMPPGTYKIACYIDMSTDHTNLSRLRFVSNELTITIAP